jgi:hypothetical protein
MAGWLNGRMSASIQRGHGSNLNWVIPNTLKMVRHSKFKGKKFNWNAPLGVLDQGSCNIYKDYVLESVSKKT